ncbi:MAG: class I SAM-dependent methyltransferase [Pseudonocardiaceae bacterium]
MTGKTAGTQEYTLGNGWQHARRRLQLLEQCYDPGTTRRLGNLGVGAGWRCLEVGAGGGSITRWLCNQVGPEGRVLATDLDTRFVEELDNENLDVRRMDLRTDALPADAFDLVHARAVLMHIPQREQILNALLAALRPGGWLLLEEADHFATSTLATGLHLEVAEAAFTGMAQAGVAIDWARHLPGLLQRRGLAEVGSDCDVSLFEGGSVGADWWRVTMSQLWEQGLVIGVTRHQLDEWDNLVSQPGGWFPGLSVVAAWGRRP